MSSNEKIERSIQNSQRRKALLAPRAICRRRNPSFVNIIPEPDSMCVVILHGTLVERS